jgi:LAO/AO transport system kinase
MVPRAAAGVFGRGIIADVSGLDEAAVEKVMQRLRAGDVRALARAVSVVEDGGAVGAALVKACRAEGRRALRIGITGAPGVGKSSLVDGLVRRLREEGKRVGVIAVDPSSPFTGGALLGDRIRVQEAVDGADGGVFFRSMASRGVMGGLARGTEDVCAVMEAAGMEVVLVETVGVGQDEVAVSGVVDCTVLLLAPGLGDEVQSEKAGVMETADVFVVNKSDREGADRLEAELVGMQSLMGGAAAPIVRTVAAAGEGVGELMEAVRRVVSEGRSAKKKRLGLEGMALDHLGIAVKSIEVARRFYESLGMTVGFEEVVEHEQVRVAMLPMGESRIELLEATAEESVIGRFVAKRGEGLHHVAIRVDGVEAMFRRLKEQGVRLASDEVRVGAGGHRYFFVHPASTGGVLVEIVGGEE